MADKEQRTEQATPKRQEKLRGEGKVPQSADVAAAAALLVTTAALGLWMSGVASDVAVFSARAFRLQDVGRPFRALGAMVPVFSGGVFPILGAAAVAAVVVSLSQTRGLFSLALIAPKWERMDPSNNIKRVLPSADTMIEIGKQLLKLVALGWVVYRVIVEATPEFAVLASMSPLRAMAAVMSVAGTLALQGGVAFALVAVLDYWLLRRRHLEDAKMSRQEVRDEHKEEEGDPHVRRRVRKRMRDVSRRRALSEVKKATVLVTNPTHVSVALRYDADKDPAPVLLAKGTDELALRMREEARRHGIPIVENRPLARAIHANGKPGQPIPAELYRAAAEVIAHVFRLRSRGAA